MAGDLTREQIEDMSSEERQKRLPEINEWYATYRGEPGHKNHLTHRTTEGTDH